jgi:uncharacterized protein YciI
VRPSGRRDLTGVEAWREAARSGVTARERSYMQTLADADKLIFGGPWVDPAEGGLLVLDVASREEARQVIEDSPLVKAGLLTAEIKKWKVSFEKGHVAT